MSPDEFFQAIGGIRRALFLSPEAHEMTRGVLQAAGFDPQECAFDPVRLRVINHEGHKNPKAQPVYHPHRDTWYAHPPGIITWWIPLHDVQEEETFAIYPECLSRPLPNDSEIFDYDAWVSRDWKLKIGWQEQASGRTAGYPQLLDNPELGAELGFSAKQAENLLFAGAHFHSTRKQATGQTRFSLDFRVLHLRDHTAGLAAPSVDNRSRGSALRDYIHTPGS